jgi:hypothetical protein
MKTNKTLTILFIAIFSIQLSNAQKVVVSDDAGYSSVANSAVLDVNSTSKGFLMPRIALASLTDQTTVASPATGLMVYNTGAGTLSEKGVYYWNGTIWEKQLTGGVSSSNYVKIDNDGTVTLNGGATTFTDLVVPPYSARNSSNSNPPWSEFLLATSGSLGFFTFAYGYVDQDADKEIFFNIQMPHDYKQGSAIYPHVHWSGRTAPGTNRVTWEFDYQWVNHTATFSDNSKSTLTGYALAGDAGRSVAAFEHVITPLGTIDGTGKTISSMLVCRLRRKTTDANDLYANSAFIISFDVHYEIDSFGSSSEFVK